jgi:hypothetical protein
MKRFKKSVSLAAVVAALAISSLGGFLFPATGAGIVNVGQHSGDTSGSDTAIASTAGFHW